MARSLTSAIVMTSLVASSALAADRVTVHGEPTKRWIEADDLGFYYEIPMGDELEIDVIGPGTLILFLVNHEATGTRGTSVLVMTKASQAWKRLKLGCVPSGKRFADETGIQPCKRMTRDLQIEAGTHRIGLRLKRTKVGASVHLLFASQEQLDLEPALATAQDGELSWEEAEDLDLVTIEAAEKPERTGGGVDVDAALKNPLMWSLTGAAAAIAGTGVAFGAHSQSRFDEAAGQVSQRRRVELNDSGKQSAVIANTLFGVAGAAAITAAVIFVLDLQTGSPEATSASVAPMGGERWGLSAEVRF
jgi:hypothetical protein